MPRSSELVGVRPGLASGPGSSAGRVHSHFSKLCSVRVQHTAVELLLWQQQMVHFESPVGCSSPNSLAEGQPALLCFPCCIKLCHPLLTLLACATSSDMTLRFPLSPAG